MPQKNKKQKKVYLNLKWLGSALSAFSSNIEVQPWKFLDNASVKKTAKNLAETFCIYIHDMYHVGNGFGIPWHFAKEYDLVF